MKEGEYYLHVDEAIPRVTFKTESFKGAKAGLADLKNCRKRMVLRRRLESASLRENRSRFAGTRLLRRGGGWLVDLFVTLARHKAYAATAEDDFQIAHLDRILVAMDQAILEIESQIAAFKAK
ncbi:hypothetical protein [Luteolibacter soli]|uniref:Uncharacterized protein n=1 Tax=Luteolibacter soli TaxID=3135280 RepID=A0ABU9ASK6_9BACT